jgi:hypothetical protein
MDIGHAGAPPPGRDWARQAAMETRDRMGAMEAPLFTGWDSDLLLPHAQTLDVAQPAIVRAIAPCGIGPYSGRRGATGTRREDTLESPLQVVDSTFGPLD